MNGARPSGAIVFKPRDEAGQSVQLTEYQGRNSCKICK